MFSIKQLYTLQELDWEIAANNKCLTEVRARLEDDSALVTAREKLDQLESRLADRRPVRKKAEQEIRQLEEKLENLDKRLYGGAITSPKYLSAAEEEREFLQQQRTSQENTLLELMVETDDLLSSVKESREHLERVETARAEEEAQLTKEQERLTAELERHEKARPELVPTIPPSVLAVYESLLKSRNGSAVAKVERGMCQGCRLALPTLELQRARSSQGIVQCSSCRRILYVV